jgi:hypothetical protein
MGHITGLTRYFGGTGHGSWLVFGTAFRGAGMVGPGNVKIPGYIDGYSCLGGGLLFFFSLGLLALALYATACFVPSLELITARHLMSSDARRWECESAGLGCTERSVSLLLPLGTHCTTHSSNVKSFLIGCCSPNTGTLPVSDPDLVVLGTLQRPHGPPSPYHIA